MIKQDFMIVTFEIVRIMVKKDVPLHELAIALVIPGQEQPPLCMVATKDPFVKEDAWYVCDALVFDENDEEVTYTCKKVEQSFKAGEITMWSLQCIILSHMFDDSQPDIVTYLNARSRPGTPKKVMGPPEEGTLADLLAPEGRRRTLAGLLRI